MTVRDRVYGHASSFQDSLRALSMELALPEVPENFAAAQRAAAQAQEALASLSVALCDAEGPGMTDRACGQKGGRNDG